MEIENWSIIIMTIHCFDIDVTICDTPESNYHPPIPIFESNKVINDLYKAGHEIDSCTACGAANGIDWRELTEKQLEI